MHRLNGLGQNGFQNGYLSPENQAQLDKIRYGAGEVYDTGQEVYQSGKKIYDVIPPTWRPVLLGIAIGWFLRGRR